MFTPFAFVKSVAAVAPSIPTAGLVMWYTPATLVTSSGRITDWTDASGTSNNASQGNNTLRPYYSASALNGYPAATFRGNSELNYLTYTNAIWDAGSGTNATTCFAVVRPTSAEAFNYGAIVSQGDGGKTSVAVCPQAYPDATIKWATNNYAAGGRKINGTSATGSFYYVTWQWSDWQVRNTTSIRVNGVLEASADWDAAPNAVDTNNLNIGNFRDNSAQSTLAADVCEILVYRTVLSAGDVSTVESYLASKYAL